MINAKTPVKWFHTNSPLPHESIRLFCYEDISDELGVIGRDGKRWYKLSCSYWFGDWIEEQDKSLWEACGVTYRCIYSVREELLTIIHLRWL